jgi:Histidine kinase-, DNA gyrase B-, and HSP90-like ATPase
MEGAAQPALTTMRRLGGVAVLAIPPPTLSDRRAPIVVAAVALSLLALTTTAVRRLLTRGHREAPTPTAPGPSDAPARADRAPADRAPADRARAHGSQALARGGGPYREGSPGAAEAGSWFPQPPPQPPPQALPAPAQLVSHPQLQPEPEPELADLARRGQELLDQLLELLDHVEGDQTDPRLAARLLQVDRLAVRARRNAHNLIVLAGGEPGRRWDGSAPLAEVVTVAVMDNPDVGRVELDVAGDLLVPREAADDLANLLAELVDNATAFSAPETRVRVRGQRVGSGYVLDVEDHGLGMTDGELEAVNRLLAGDPAALDDPGQRLGARVAGRLAARHDVRVRLRRSPGGGVTALVLLPERLVAPPRPYGFRVPEADPPLPRRAPHASLAPDLAAAADPGHGGQESPPAARSPEQVRSMLRRYRSGLERGRAEAARDLPDDPDGDPEP